MIHPFLLLVNNLYFIGINPAFEGFIHKNPWNEEFIQTNPKGIEKKTMGINSHKSSGYN